ncbi:MAG: electron transfer flavoprotein subunit beta/FixA family protein [Acidilobaceae archaeon]|nr:electron transfer flavoprotein subunit beta/FixA family protein [Acidilobaceae archaeon]
MKDIVVLVKASLNPEIVRQAAEGKFDVDYTPLKISDIDRNALEEASRLKAVLGGKVYAISVLSWGPVKARDKDVRLAVQEALAKVADEAYLVEDDEILPTDQVVVANAIAALVKAKGLRPAIVLAGEASVDESTSQVPARVAAKLGYSFVGHVNKILEVKEGRVVVERDVEEYYEVLEVSLPAVISVTQSINEPRPPTLIQIRMASKKPLHGLSAKELGVSKPRRSIVEMKVVTTTRKQVVIEEANVERAVEKLLELLEKEGVLK